MKGSKKSARSLFEKAIGNLPENEMGYFQRGLILVECGNDDDASKQFSKVLELNPSHINARVNMALIFGRKGEFEKAEKLIDVIYQEDKKKKDCNARLGWIKSKAKDWSGALELMDKDREAGRLSPLWQINLAQVYAQTGDFITAMDLIERAYAINEVVKDGYARLGWIKTKTQDWSGACELMNRDLKSNRISPIWQVHLAQMVGRRGEWDRAIELIEQAYAANHDLRNGYARLGWIKADIQDWSGVFDLMAKDHKKGRLSAEWQKKMAMILVFKGDPIGAAKMIEDCYSNEIHAVDGYALLGWAHYMASGNEQQLQGFVQKDAELERLSVEGKKIEALAMGINGALTAAGILMDTLYSENSSLQDGFSILGWIHIERRVVETGLKLMEKDYQLGRLSTVWRVNFAYQLARAGKTQKARVLLEEVMDLVPHRKKFHIGYQAFPLDTITKSQFQQMVGL